MILIPQRSFIPLFSVVLSYRLLIFMFSPCVSLVFLPSFLLFSPSLLCFSSPYIPSLLPSFIPLPVFFLPDSLLSFLSSIMMPLLSCFIPVSSFPFSSLPPFVSSFFPLFFLSSFAFFPLFVFFKNHSFIEFGSPPTDHLQ